MALKFASFLLFSANIVEILIKMKGFIIFNNKSGKSAASVLNNFILGNLVYHRYYAEGNKLSKIPD